MKDFFYTNYKKIILLFTSFLGTVGILKYYELFSGPSILNNLFNILFIIIIYTLYKKCSFKNNINVIFSCCLSFILGIILIIGAQLDLYGDIIWSLITILKILLLAIAILPITLYITELLDKLKKPKKAKLSKKTFLIVFAIILVTNFLAFLALYPGMYGYDAGFQILMFFDKTVDYTNHFSLVYSFFLSSCIYIGKLIFHSNVVGLALYSFIQMTIMAYVATRICTFSFKLTNNKYLFYFSILFFSLFPLYLVMVLSTAQDTLFAGIFALLIIVLIEQSMENKKANYIKLVILSFLLCVTRNNGFFAILVAIVLILLFNRKNNYSTLVLFIVGMIFFKIFTGPIYDLIGVNKESAIKEASSIPSQQLARVYNYNYKALTREDIKKYDDFYDLENFSFYKTRQSISDPIKSSLDVSEVDHNKIDYIIFWSNIGFKDPENYIEACFLNNLGSWYPNKKYNDDRMYHPYIEYEMLDAKFWNKKYEVIERHSLFPIYNKILHVIVYNNYWQKIPIISILFEASSYFILFLFSLGIVLIKKKKVFYNALLLTLGLYLTIFLAPVSLFRYSFPIVIIFPIMISMLLKKEN